MKKVFSLVVLVITVITFSCKTVTEVIDDNSPIKKIGTQRLIKSVYENQLNFDYLNISKFAAQYTSDNDTKSFKGALRIKEDSSTFMSISPLMGIEMFRLILQTDSIYFIDRYNKNYFVGDYEFLDRKLNFEFDLGLIENVLCGQLYSYNYKKTPEKALKHYKINIVDNHYILETPDKRRFDQVYCRYEIDSKYRILSGTMKDLVNGYELDFKYDDYKKIAGGYFPGKVDITIINSTSQINLNLVYKKVSLSAKLAFPFNVSSKYKKIEIQ